jgi:hypothetical protein
MSVPTTSHDPALLITLFLFTGGGITTGLTLLINWLIQRRQRKQSITEVRIRAIAKSAPLYNKIALYNAWNLSHQLMLSREERNTKLMFYYACNILNLRRQIVNTIGDLQFADLTAETIISDLGRAITSSISDHFGPVNSSLMTSIVDNDLPFHEFHDVILRDWVDLFHNFEQWIAKDEISIQIERNCRWYAQLIMYELNFVYMIWYDEPPSFMRLDPDLRSYLEQNQSSYFRRLRKIETSSLL